MPDAVSSRQSGGSTLEWRGLPAACISDGDLEAWILADGAQVGSLRLRSQPTELLWQPPWPSAPPGEADDRWGSAPGRDLLGLICGWTPCIDRFGWSADDGGRPPHGEAAQQRWALTVEADRVLARTHLPIADLDLERRYQLRDGALHCRTRIRAGANRPAESRFEWAEHICLDPGFLDGAVITADADAATLHPDHRVHAAPLGEPGLTTDPATVLAWPGPDDPARGDIATLRLRRGSWTVHNQRLGLELSANFDATRFPWLCCWTEHRARSQAPWLGRTRVRGLECATKPFPEGELPANWLETSETPQASLEFRAGWLEAAICLSVRRLGVCEPRSRSWDDEVVPPAGSPVT